MVSCCLPGAIQKKVYGNPSDDIAHEGGEIIASAFRFDPVIFQIHHSVNSAERSHVVKNLEYNRPGLWRISKSQSPMIEHLVHPIASLVKEFVYLPIFKAICSTPSFLEVNAHFVRQWLKNQRSSIPPRFHQAVIIIGMEFDSANRTTKMILAPK